jgi:HK97 family phage prohead protease
MELKTLSLSDCEIKYAQSEGAFSGYGSVFGVVDAKNDIIMPGAYADVLAGDSPPVDVYVNHNWLDAQLPVGRWFGLKEDARGLIGEANLVMQMRGASDAYWAMKSGLVSGLSVAIIPDPKSTERRSDGVRIIHRIKALKEISIVTDPANDQARITDIKGIDEMRESIESLESIKDFERLLREVGPFNRDSAKHLIAKARMLLAKRDEADAGDMNAAANAKALALAIKLSS